MAGAQDSEQKKYQGLGSPEQILKDYDLKTAFDEGKSTKEIAKEIWQDYGGNPEGPEASFYGQWPEDDESQQLGPQGVDDKFKSTEDKKWERLVGGKTILDIFNGTKEIEDYVSWYASGMGLTKAAAPQGGAAASAASWYKAARANYNTVN